MEFVALSLTLEKDVAYLLNSFESGKRSPQINQMQKEYIRDEEHKEMVEEFQQKKI